jgi:CRISPR-associated protein Csm3
MTEFKGVIEIGGAIECITGLHVGGGAVGYEIGGTENPVIRDPASGYPYLPGSSLKGKMRSLLEWAEGKVDLARGGPHACSDMDCPVCRVFGTSGAEERRAGPTRLLVRDAHPDEDSRARMDRLEREQGLPKVEVKTEVVIDRVAGAALGRVGPRSQERVPVGSRFNFSMQYWMFDVDGCRVSDLDLLPKVFEALRMVEDSALGGGGSRGSGQVAFHLRERPLVKTVEDYRTGNILRPEEGLVKLVDLDVSEFCTAVRIRFEAKQGGSEP